MVDKDQLKSSLYKLYENGIDEFIDSVADMILVRDYRLMELDRINNSWQYFNQFNVSSKDSERLNVKEMAC